VLKRKTKESAAAYMMLAPSLILFSVVGLFSIVFSILISFYNWDGIDFSKARFIGLRNFQMFLTGLRPAMTENFYNSILHNLEIAVVSIIFIIPIALAIAVMVVSAGKMSGFFRTIYFIPMVTAGAATYYAWQGLFRPDGMLNSVMQFLNLNFLVVKDGMLGNERTALIGIIMTVIWSSVPSTMILYYAGLMSIDGSIYEAASIDGASKFQTTVRITWPLLKPMTMIAIISTMNGCFQMFDNVWILTKGGPANSTQVAGSLIYQVAYGNTAGLSGYGLASAMGWIVFTLTLVLSFFSLKVFKTDY
jgi:ABC-type sugar transport system permease subunit